MNELTNLLNDNYELAAIETIAEKIITGKLADITENEIFLLQTEIEIAVQINRVDAIFNRLTNDKEEMTDDTNN